MQQQFLQPKQTLFQSSDPTGSGLPPNIALKSVPLLVSLSPLEKNTEVLPNLTFHHMYKIIQHKGQRSRRKRSPEALHLTATTDYVSKRGSYRHKDLCLIVCYTRK